MSRYLSLILLLAGMILSLTSCGERSVALSKSPDGRIIVYEELISRPGLAPNTVSTYLLVGATTPSEGTDPVFEGQDVGRICYDWPSPTALNIRISGGYVDHVASHWIDPSGNRIAVRYLGTLGCVWKPELG